MQNLDTGKGAEVKTSERERWIRLMRDKELTEAMMQAESQIGELITMDWEIDAEKVETDMLPDADPLLQPGPCSDILCDWSEHRGCRACEIPPTVCNKACCTS